MIALGSVVALLSMLSACSAIPVVGPEKANRDIESRDEYAIVSGEVCANNGPWGSARGDWLKQYSDFFASKSGLAFQIDSRSPANVCHQVACFADGTPGTIWVCLHQRTVMAPGRRDLISYKQLADATNRIYNRCPNTYTGRVFFDGQDQNWDIVVSGHSCDGLGTSDDLNDALWGLF